MGKRRRNPHSRWLHPRLDSYRCSPGARFLRIGKLYIKAKSLIIIFKSQYNISILRCVPKSQCSDGGMKANACAVDLRSVGSVDLRQDYNDEDEIVCCSVESIKNEKSCETGYT